MATYSHHGAKTSAAKEGKSILVCLARQECDKGREFNLCPLPGKARSPDDCFDHFRGRIKKGGAEIL
jgi:hypothetical protein